MKLFLAQKPWMAAESAEGGGMAQPAATYGLRVFLAVVTMLFLLAASAYWMRMGMGDWRPLPDPGILWLNSALLAASDLALGAARRAERRDVVRRWLYAAGLLGLGFLAGQWLAWRELVGFGYFAANNPAYAFFYLLTGLHALHIAGGLAAFGRVIGNMRAAPLADLRASVGLCATYWHYLLLIWIGLFGLLLAT